MASSFSMWLSHPGIANGGSGKSNSLSCFSYKGSQRYSKQHKNHKRLLKALKTAQLETPGHNVLKVILPCNTRKWSSGFLCIARILQLQHYLIAMAA